MLRGVFFSNFQLVKEIRIYVFNLICTFQLFSAQIDNKPVEVIEVSLSKMEMAQCRGIKNSKSQYHTIILNLIKKSLDQISSRMKKQNLIKP